RTVLAAGNAEVHDVALAEPGDTAGRPGELVLGVGVTDRAGTLALLERTAGAGAAVPETRQRPPLPATNGGSLGRSPAPLASLASPRP
ncbi:hypothetical protein, partial [Streptomyces sp. NPDC001292]|uniref:hypothetical protein n=1 Tax=Streptomyces sp. NPDC001292 TaxID=3364558 RepID=UPI0036969B54